jgi:intracellular septation protein
MGFFFDIFPIILFFAAFKLKGIYVATGVAIAATIVQAIYSYFKKGKIEPMLIVSLVVVSVFGGATLLLKNEIFIKWKPSVIYWLIAIALLLAHLVFKKNLMMALMKKQIELPQKIWDRVNIWWATFFATMGILNLIVVYNFSTELWVNFKLFGVTGLMLVFLLIQGAYLTKYMPKEKNSEN